MIFRVTAAFKNLQLDDYENGCHGESSCFALPSGQSAKTFAELIKSLCDEYCFDIDSFSWMEEEKRAVCQVLETEDGLTANESDIALWKQGDKKLWLCDYDFHIEAYEVVDITEDMVSIPNF